MFQMNGYPPVSKVSKEVANITERKNPHTPVLSQFFHGKW